MDAISFFIVGAQRSGTTLLRLMLNNHPAVAIPEEGSFFMPLITAATFNSARMMPRSEKIRFTRYLAGNAQFAKWKLPIEAVEGLVEQPTSYAEYFGRIYGAFAKKENKLICGDKTPPFIRKLPILAEAFPRSKFVHIVRDGRDLYLSMRSRHHPSADSLGVFALEWVTKLAYINLIRQKYRERLYEIRYEDLLRAPEKTLIQVTSFLEIPYDAIMLEFWRHSSQYIDKQHSELIFGPVDANNVEKWRGTFSPAESRLFCLFAGDVLSRYGYSVSRSRARAMDIVSAALQVLFFVPRRIMRILIVSSYMKVAKLWGLPVPTAFYS